MHPTDKYDSTFMEFVVSIITVIVSICKNIILFCRKYYIFVIIDNNITN